MRNKGSADLINFLTEDLKVTSEHLRDTDKKLSVWIQIYGGAFAVTISATFSLIANRINPSPFLLFGEGIFLLAFSLWLFRFSLRCKETKAIYINRINYLRELIREKFSSKSRLKIGDWTRPINVYPKSAPGKVGVDDLYSYALQWVMILLVFLLIVEVFNQMRSLSGEAALTLLGYILASLSALITYRVTKSEMKDADEKAQEDINKLRKSVT